MNIPMSLVRKAEMNLLPPDGAWVVVRGNPFAGRGLRIPDAIREEGVTHFSIYYAYDEGCPWNADSETIYKLVGDLKKDALSKERAEEFMDDVLAITGISSFQRTWVTLHTPSSKLIRFYNGELSVFSRDLLDDLLSENMLEIHAFSDTHLNPVWDDAIRDMIGSLQLDGLSFQEAQDELIRAGEKFQQVHQKLPNYYYKPVGWLYDTFCEEPEYQEWTREHEQIHQDSSG